MTHFRERCWETRGQGNQVSLLVGDEGKIIVAHIRVDIDMSAGERSRKNPRDVVRSRLRCRIYREEF